MITIKNLNQFYGQSHTLWDLNLEIEQGNVLVLWEEMELVKQL